MATTTIKNGFQGGTDDQLLVNPDGSIDVNVTGSVITGSIDLVSVGGVDIHLGQTTMSLSLPVTIASDQTPIPVTGSITATNPSVGLNSTTAPTSSTQIGAQTSGGNLVPLLVDPAGRLLVDISGTSVVSGTVNADILGLTAFQTSQYTVGTSAIQLTPTPLSNRSSMTMKVVCTGTNIIYVGNSSAVTSSTGYPLFNGDSLQMDLTPAQVIYAIATNANQMMYILEIA